MNGSERKLSAGEVDERKMEANKPKSAAKRNEDTTAFIRDMKKRHPIPKFDARRQTDINDLLQSKVIFPYQQEEISRQQAETRWRAIVGDPEDPSVGLGQSEDGRQATASTRGGADKTVVGPEAKTDRPLADSLSSAADSQKSGPPDRAQGPPEAKQDISMAGTKTAASGPHEADRNIPRVAARQQSDSASRKQMPDVRQPAAEPGTETATDRPREAEPESPKRGERERETQVPAVKESSPEDAPSRIAEPAKGEPARETPAVEEEKTEETPVVPVQPQWKVLEPEDRSDPVEHEVYAHTRRNDTWNIMAASVRGKLHAHKALWRDDAFAYGGIDDWTIVAVSDGAGSARISRIGARIACDESVKTLKNLLAGFRLSSDDPNNPTDQDLFRLRTFLSEGARKAQVGILREAQERKCSPRDLYATLLLLIHVPLGKNELVGAIQIGDGAVGILTGDGTCTLMGIADHGEYSSETRFLTTPHIEHEFEHRVLFSIKRDIRCLAAMCDGVSDDFFPEEKRLVELFVGNPISELRTRDDQPAYGLMHSVLKKPDDGRSLLEWLKYEKRQSSDDRTLVVMYRNRVQ